MSKCDDYGEQISKTEGKISQLKEELRETILGGVMSRDLEKERELKSRIKVQEQKLESLNDKYKRSLRAGGC